MAEIKVCPRCESRKVKRRPNDGFMPHPGYVCDNCKLVMRPKGARIWFAAMMVVGIAVTVFTLLPWFDIKHADRLPIGLPIAGAIIAVISLYQMFRPAPRFIDEDDNIPELTQNFSHVICPYCNTSLEFKPEISVGQNVACLNCRATFPAAPPALESGAHKICPHCGYRPIGLFTDSCPMCAEPVRDVPGNNYQDAETYERGRRHRRKFRFVVTAILLFTAAIVAAIGYMSYKKEKIEAEADRKPIAPVPVAGGNPGPPVPAVVGGPVPVAWPDLPPLGNQMPWRWRSDDHGFEITLPSDLWKHTPNANFIAYFTCPQPFGAAAVTEVRPAKTKEDYEAAVEYGKKVSKDTAKLNLFERSEPNANGHPCWMFIADTQSPTGPYLFGMSITLVREKAVIMRWEAKYLELPPERRLMEAEQIRSQAKTYLFSVK